MAKKPTKKQSKPTSDEAESPADDRPTEIAVVGELFDELEVDIVKTLLETPEGGEVVFYIDSSGGSVYSAAAIVALLRLRKLDATAVVLSECSSAAIVIFAACRRRIVTPRSVFLFHRIKWRSEKDMRREEAVNWAQHFLWLETEIDRYQADLFGKAAREIEQWIDQGRFVNGPELAKMGLAELVDV
jgi:ATP-dependent protease ClpP protease subunit